MYVGNINVVRYFVTLKQKGNKGIFNVALSSILIKRSISDYGKIINKFFRGEGTKLLVVLCIIDYYQMPRSWPIRYVIRTGLERGQTAKLSKTSKWDSVATTSGIWTLTGPKIEKHRRLTQIGTSKMCKILKVSHFMCEDRRYLRYYKWFRLWRLNV